MFLSTDTIRGIERMFAGVSSRLNFPLSFPFPYSWNRKDQTFSVKSGFKIWWIVPFTVYLLASALQVVLQIVKSNMQTWERIQSTYFILGYATMALYFTRFHHNYAEDVCYFLNQVILYEKHLKIADNQNEVKFWRNRESRVVVLVGNFLDDSFRLLVLMVPVVAAYLPDSPWNPLAALIVMAPTEYTQGWIFRVATYLEYYLFWRIFMDVCIVSYVVNFLLSLYALKCMVLEFERSIQFVKWNTAHLKDQLSEYRKLQIIFGLYNTIHRNTLLVGITVVTLSITITFTYLWIGNFNELNVVMLCSCVLLTISEGMQIMVGFGFAGRIYSVSRSVNAKVAMVVRKNWNKWGSWAMKFWKSCPVLRIQLFSTNYFDPATSLILNQFCVEQTIDLVLLS